MTLKTLIVIQARNGSSRLPFKSIMSIAGIPVILHLALRLKANVQSDHKLVVATSTNPEDDLIAHLLRLNHIEYYRGHPTNVLSRFQELECIYRPNYIVRVTGDCPLIDASLPDDLINHMIINSGTDYVSNTLSRTYPHGHDVEAFKASLLQKESFSAFDELSYEHVTPFIYNSVEFRSDNYSMPHQKDFSWMRLTLDYAEDLLFVDKLLEAYLDLNPDFTPLDNLKPYIIQQLLGDPVLTKMHDLCHAKAMMGLANSALK